jgi:hypothetical protein
MTRRALALFATLALLVSAGCSSAPQRPAEYVPPRLDLARYGALGLAQLESRHDALGADATQELLAAIHAAQPGTRVLELGRLAKLDPAAVRALAAREKVDAIWVGEISEAASKPRVSVDALYRTGAASAERKAKLSVRLLDGATGATVWSAWSERTIPVATAAGSLRDGVSQLSTRPQDEARAILVRDLVNDVTYDLRPQWVQR